MKIIRSEKIQTSNWSGGQTSEIFIYPEDSNYNNLNFYFRLSRATIETEYSVFSSLSNVKRQLMVLKGELSLFHKNHYNINLNPFESDSFSGGWQTESRGIVTDFNLMMLGKTDGYIKTIITDDINRLKVNTNCDLACLYVFEGGFDLNDVRLNKSDALILEGPSREIEIEASAFSKIIVTRIWLNLD